LTQIELAERIGQTQPFVSSYERSERRLDVIEFENAMGLDRRVAFAQLLQQALRQTRR
jgi:transcriptional regulator with XRE-family HTH domain